jgi:predicted porin
MGHFTAPYDDITNIGTNNTGNTGILTMGNLWAQGTQDDVVGGFDNRLKNSIRWDSPTWAGFKTSVQFATAEDSPSANSNQGGMSGTYQNGPFLAVAAYQYNNNIRGLKYQELDDSAFSIGAQWQFSQFNIGAKYEWLDYDFTQSSSLKRQYWEIASTILVGANGSVYISYGDAADGKGSAPTGAKIGQLVKGTGTGANTWQISYAHNLSKRTYVYTGYGKINNDNNAAYTGNFRNPVQNGANPGGFSMGMWHNF